MQSPLERLRKKPLTDVLDCRGGRLAATVQASRTMFPMFTCGLPTMVQDNASHLHLFDGRPAGQDSPGIAHVSDEAQLLVHPAAHLKPPPGPQLAMMRETPSKKRARAPSSVPH